MNGPTKTGQFSGSVLLDAMHARVLDAALMDFGQLSLAQCAWSVGEITPQSEPLSKRVSSLASVCLRTKPDTMEFRSTVDCDNLQQIQRDRWAASSSESLRPLRALGSGAERRLTEKKAVCQTPTVGKNMCATGLEQIVLTNVLFFWPKARTGKVNA